MCQLGSHILLKGADMIEIASEWLFLARLYVACKIYIGCGC
jgi:hypothetical protein